MSYLNLRWFMQTLLDRMDRTSMAWGLEARVPFADHRIVEYVYNVPWSMKYERRHGKAAAPGRLQGPAAAAAAVSKEEPLSQDLLAGIRELCWQSASEQMLSDPQSAGAPLFGSRERPSASLQQPKDYGRPWFGQLMAGPQMIAYFLQINYWMERCGIG